MKQKWYDYLWIAELAYWVLGLLNILFAWLGVLFFCIPLLLQYSAGTRATATVTAAGGSFWGCWAGNCPETYRRQDSCGVLGSAMAFSPFS